MSKTKISLYDADPGNNTDIDGINLAEGMAPGLVNNAIRELMAQLKDFQVGSAGDPLTVGGNLSVAGTTTLLGNVAITGTATISGRSVDALPSGTKMLFQQSTAPVGWVKDTTHNDKALRVVTGTVSSGGTVGFSSAFVSKAVTGTIADTTAGGTVGGTALSATQLPSHNHTGNGTTSLVSNDHVHGFSATTDSQGLHSHGINDPGHAHSIGYTGNLGYSGGGGNPNTFWGAGSNQSTNAALTGISTITNGAHNHSVSGTTGGISANHSHTYSFTTSSVGSGSTHTHGFSGTAHNHTFTGTAIDLAVQYVDVIICTKS